MAMATNYVLPQCKYKLFKVSFINWCRFNVLNHTLTTFSVDASVVFSLCCVFDTSAEHQSSSCVLEFFSAPCLSISAYSCTSLILRAFIV